MGIEKISTCKIKLSPYPDRLDRELPEVIDHSILYDIPLIVVHSKESDSYFVTKHTSLFGELKDRGEESILCDVRQEVDSDQEAYIIRLVHVLDDRIPFHILEQARCITACQEDLFLEEGEDSYYKNGGDRRSDNFKKKSLLEEVLKRLPYKAASIDILRRFGGHLSPYGIEGLFRLVIEEGQNIPLRFIHDNNAKLGKQGLRSTIDDLIQKLKAEAKTEEQIKDEIGLLVYKILFGEEQNPPDTKAPKQPDPTQRDTVSINPPFRSVDEQGLVDIREAFSRHFADQEKLAAFFDGKVSLTDAEAEELDDIVEAMQTSFTDFVNECHRVMKEQ